MIVWHIRIFFRKYFVPPTSEKIFQTAGLITTSKIAKSATATPAATNMKPMLLLPAFCVFSTVSPDPTVSVCCAVGEESDKLSCTSLETVSNPSNGVFASP